MKLATSGLTGFQLHFTNYAKHFFYLIDVRSLIVLVWQTRNLSPFTSSSKRLCRDTEFSIRVVYNNTASVGCCAVTAPTRLHVHRWASSYTHSDSLTHKHGLLHKHMEEEKRVTETPVALRGINLSYIRHTPMRVCMWARDIRVQWQCQTLTRLTVIKTQKLDKRQRAKSTDGLVVVGRRYMFIIYSLFYLFLISMKK